MTSEVGIHHGYLNVEKRHMEDLSSKPLAPHLSPKLAKRRRDSSRFPNCLSQKSSDMYDITFKLSAIVGLLRVPHDYRDKEFGV